jgi:hypothetical protein
MCGQELIHLPQHENENFPEHLAVQIGDHSWSKEAERTELRLLFCGSPFSSLPLFLRAGSGQMCCVAAEV